MTKLAAPALLIALAGCATDPDVDANEPVPGKDGLPTFEGDLAEPAPEMLPLVADMCDEPAYGGATWQTTTTGHFALSYLPGTVADAEQDAIARRLEAAYEDIRSALGVTAEPTITVNLSPSRNAAYAHNRGFGRAWPQSNRYDVIYTGAWDSYEKRRYGQLLTYMLDYHLDANNRYRHPLLATGVAELLDQSKRDLHIEYAKNLAAGLESRVRIAEFDSKDVNGRNTGRSGSLVKFLVGRYGMETFMDIYRATAITWNSSYGCNWHNAIGCVSTPEQVTAMLDSVLYATVGEGWADVQPEWALTVETAMEQMPTEMESARSEIENVLRVMDHAITTNAAALYRTTIEGFYCDWGGDSVRDEIANRAVTAYGGMRTQLLALYDTGIKNFATAHAFVMRTDDSGVPSFQTIQFEHVEAGWRVSYSPDWY